MATEDPIRFWSPWLGVFAALWLAAFLLLARDPTTAVAEHGALVVVGFFGALIGTAITGWAAIGVGEVVAMAHGLLFIWQSLR